MGVLDQPRQTTFAAASLMTAGAPMGSLRTGRRSRPCRTPRGGVSTGVQHDQHICLHNACTAAKVNA
jgi:hypothetical protein